MRKESGLSLVELLISMSMITVVMLAMFGALNSFGLASSQNLDQNQAQSTARVMVDRLARELRSTSNSGQTTPPIERANVDDIVFETVDPTSAGSGSNTAGLERVRYCLDSTLKLWRQVQTWTMASPPATPSSVACPHTSFGSQVMVADTIVNKSGSLNRAVFTYDSSTLASIGAVTIDLYVDKDVTRAPSEQRLSTTVFLRNQNRAPTAGLTATPTGSRHVLLNASASSDPDNDGLTYTWYDGSTSIGTGVILDYASPTTGNHTFSVKVTDPAGLNTTSAAQTVNVN